jgi:glycosyltransferase involved in cell wall biosynthesis
MRVLQLHNRYSRRGGEDSVIDAEHALLSERGHDVVQYFASNEGIVGRRGLGALRAGLNLVWSAQSYRDVEQELRRVRPDIVHVHNTFASLSSSVFWAAKAAGIPVVLSLHNFRITCATSVLLRDGVPCEECVGRLPIPAFVHRCSYVGSTAVGAALASSQIVHNTIGTYRKKIDAYIALTEFSRDIFERAGLPSDRLHVKPNFVPAPPVESEQVAQPRQIVFVGLVSTVKGVDLLLEASRRATEPHRLFLVGEGPDRPALEAEFGECQHIRWCGHIPPDEALAVVSRSRWLVLASRWYEGMPMVIIEALAAGRPVIVPDHGPFPSIVWPNRNALLFRANDPESLREVLDRANAMSDEEWRGFSDEARALHTARYAPESNYGMLMDVYAAAASVASRSSQEPK